MDPTSLRFSMAASGYLGGPSTAGPPLGTALEGGFFAGAISHSSNGVATHLLIVAPRATGASGGDYTITTELPWKYDNTSTPGTSNQFDGAINTGAMIAAGIQYHPAANFCVGLSIGGYSDWYLPSIFELDIAYFNLKPSTNVNATFGSTGVNPYSVPARVVNYTESAPSQTSITDFRINHPQDFRPNFHWSSTEVSASNARGVDFFNGSSTFGNFVPKTFTTKVRAFRKIAV